MGAMSEFGQTLTISSLAHSGNNAAASGISQSGGLISNTAFTNILGSEIKN